VRLLALDISAHISEFVIFICQSVDSCLLNSLQVKAVELFRLENNQKPNFVPLVAEGLYSECFVVQEESFTVSHVSDGQVITKKPIVKVNYREDTWPEPLYLSDVTISIR
jgi:hypothetical protein